MSRGMVDSCRGRTFVARVRSIAYRVCRLLYLSATDQPKGAVRWVTSQATREAQLAVTHGHQQHLIDRERGNDRREDDLYFGDVSSGEILDQLFHGPRIPNAAPGKS